MSQSSDNIISLSSIDTRQIDWIINPILAFGKITIIQGDPGIGKTTLAINIAAGLSTAHSIDGTHLSEPINVVYQSAEDNYNDTIKPKFIKANADMDRIYFWDESRTTFSILDESIEDIIIQKNIKLLIIDPIQAYIGQIDINRANEVRERIRLLKNIAERTNCAILLLGHLNKAQKVKTTYRGLGSIDFIALARCVLMLERESDNTRIAHQVKNNMAADTLCFRFVLTDHFAFKEWFEKPSAEPSVTKIELATRLLQSMLVQGDVASTDVYHELQSTHNISKRTIQIALSKLDSIKSVRRGDRWYLHLDNDKNID